MLKGTVSRIHLRQLEDLFHSGIAGDLSDGELLDRFVSCADPVGEAAFTALVERHGSMVFRVCKQALNDHHAAQDAVQATFLVLARRAGTIRQRSCVSSWLFGVARRAAARIRMEEARRRHFEMRSAERSATLIGARNEPPDPDPYPELHAEIERLPENYRIPVVLCYFEGLTHEQAASRLRWPLGTVKIRLSRARERLRSRLEKRGRPSLLLLPAHAFRPGDLAELPELLVNSITQAGCRYAATGVAGGLVSATVQKVTQGVMKSMLLHKLKWAGAAVSGLFLLGFGALVAAQQATGKSSAGQADTAIAERRDSPTTLRLAGSTELTPDMTVRIRPPFDCRVDRVLVERGEGVKKGDALLELFSTELAAAKNDFEVAGMQHSHDAKVLELRSSLAATNAISKQALVDSENNETKSRLQMKLARDRLILMGLTDKEIENAQHEDATQKARMTLRSRGDGLVIERSAVPGNLYDRKDTLMVVAGDDPLRVTVYADEKDFPNVKLGQSLTISFPFDERQVKAKVETIAYRIDPGTPAVKIQTSIPNPDHRLKPKMFVQLALETEARHDRIDEPRGSAPGPLESTTRDRLSELEAKVDRLLGEREERLSHGQILERLDALERKVDRLLDGRP